MKALTISQPFASLIADGEKWVENRSWHTPHRGPLAIHAGKGTHYLDRKELGAYPTGAVIAVAQIVSCVELEPLKSGIGRNALEQVGIRFLDLVQHEHTEGPWCWILTNVVKLQTPVECRGAQGLWEWNP